MFSIILLSSFIFTFSAQQVSAGGNDWVNPAFILKKSGAPSAQRTITSYAKSSAKKGPWTVYGGDGSVLPPDKDKLDYLSWAPYHWPDCGWCQGGQAHLSTGENRTNAGGMSDNSTIPVPAEDGGDVEYGDDDVEGDSDAYQPDDSEGDGGDEDSDTDALPDIPVSVPLTHRKMIKRAKSFSRPQDKSKIAEDSSEETNILTQTRLVPASTLLSDAEPTSTSDVVFSASQTGVENARKTSKPKPKEKSTHKTTPTKTKGNGGKCTPSPTKSLAPSATWTTCKYVVRDGKVNPDVRHLYGVQSIADTSQSIIYNAMANVITGSASYAQSAATAINVFFLDTQTGMHPRISYGQVIRGPQKQTGQYLGVLDFRSMVKVANAVLVMQANKVPAWTSALDSKMQTWTSQYLKWLQTSAIGKQAIAAPNNHGTFAANQLAAMSTLAGDDNAAGAALKSYFTGQFLDQIAASGEQPFEAVRTRPFHYRCFNLEAMITNAKLGDQLGLNFWTAKSKYGATIKDALDFVMKKGPGKEKVADIFPHVAAIAAVYGDPGGKYMAYLKKMDPHYMTAPYYYYDQPAALTRSKETSVGKDLDSKAEWLLDELAPFQETLKTEESDGLPDAQPTIPWECPAIFETVLRVQLDDGIFVTCDDLKPFYGYAEDTMGEK